MSQNRATRENPAHDQHLLSGLIRIHLLYHACEGPIFGLEMIEELRHHGYNLSAGTLYPMLHRMERTGLLESEQMQAGGRRRRVYRATVAGRQTMRRARNKVKILFREILGE